MIRPGALHSTCASGAFQDRLGHLRATATAFPALKGSSGQGCVTAPQSTASTERKGASCHRPTSDRNTAMRFGADPGDPPGADLPWFLLLRFGHRRRNSLNQRTIADVAATLDPR
jgi:hypothetical protein